MSQNAISVWDFTSFQVKNENDFSKFIEGCRKYSKKWGFQIETTKTGNLHCQGRVSLKKKVRKPSELFEMMDGFRGAHWSPTSKLAAKGECFYEYVEKAESRVSGPWNDRKNGEKQYIPRQYRNCKFRPFQEKIQEICAVFEDRFINILYCPVGNKGKSVCAHIMRLMHGAIILPVINDAKDIIQSACDQLIGKRLRSVGGVFIDMPRAMNKDRLYGVYSAIEQVKQGWVYDTRYKWREWDFDSPCVWVFTNAVPDQMLLSRDRWKFWTIDDKYELIKYVPIDKLDFVEDP